MSNNSKGFGSYFKLIIFLVAAGFIINMIINNTAAFVNILIVLLGFGAVVMIHEFGHFIVAKLSGIKVEAFSIGFPPTFIGIQKTDKGIRFRILPKFGSTDDDDSGKGESDTEKPADEPKKAMAECTLKCNCKPSDTEYRIGMIPFGGFVKMLGQEDSGSVEETNDPRSFANKPASIKIAVVAAGVVFNAISAIFIFMGVFLYGLDSPPAMVGDVAPNSPAAIAGIRPGDRFIDIDGEDFLLDFTSIAASAALSDAEIATPITVKHADGSIEKIELTAAIGAMSGMPIKGYGISQPSSMKVAETDDAELIELLEEKTGFRPGDIIKTANGIDVEYEWQLNEIIYNSLKPQVTLGIERLGSEELIILEKDLTISAGTGNFTNELDLTNFCTMVPRLKVSGVAYTQKPQNWKQKVLAFWSEKILRHKKPEEDAEVLMDGDVILAVADKQNPTYADLRQLTKDYKDKELAITVLRKDEEKAKIIEELLEKLPPEMVPIAKGILSPYDTINVTVTPHAMPSRSDEERVTIGIGVELDTDHPVVAATMDSQQGITALDIPSGATITAIAGQKVTSFWDIFAALKNTTEQNITIDYRIDDSTGSVKLAASEIAGNINARTLLAVGLPTDPLKVEVKAESPGEAIKMGAFKVKSFIGQSLTTLRGLFAGDVSPKALSGPVGIVSASYTIAEKSFVYYIYFMGIISSVLAVMNLLPMPIVDGGVIVLILIEKIKGSPVNTKVQEIIAYAGLAFIGLLFAWLIFNDFLNILFS